MTAHSNLYADLSTRTPGHQLSAYSGFIADPNGALLPAWRQVFEEFPNRLMFGTDNVFQTRDEKYRNYLLTETAYFRKILGQLPPDLAEKIGYANIQKVMKLEQPASLSIGAETTFAAIVSPVKVAGKPLLVMKDVLSARDDVLGSARVRTDVDSCVDACDPGPTQRGLRSLIDDYQIPDWNR